MNENNSRSVFQHVTRLSLFRRRFAIKRMLLVGLIIAMGFVWGLGAGARDWFPAAEISAARAYVATFLGPDGESASPASEISDAELQLIEAEFARGELVFHFRHALRTNAADIHGLDAMESAGESATELFQYTCLNSEGIAQAHLTRWIFETLHIAVAHVFASPSCRAVQHAEIAQLGLVILAPELHYMAFPTSRSSQFLDEQAAFLSGLKSHSGNIVMFGHGVVAFEGQPAVIHRSDVRREQGGVTIYRRSTGMHALEEVITFPTQSDFLKAFW